MHGARAGAQHVVAERVAEPVVDVLEEIEIQYGQGLVPVAVQGSEAPLYHAAVHQSGQRIALRQLSERHASSRAMSRSCLSATKRCITAIHTITTSSAKATNISRSSQSGPV